MTARNRLTAQSLLRINLHGKAHLLPELRQHVYVARSFVPEAEVEALMHLACMQFLFQDALSELPRRHQRKIASKRQDEHGVNARGFEQAQFLRQRSKQLQSG